MSKAKILYVEDYPVIQQIYVDVLTKQGFSVDVASDGKQALEKSKDTEYDLVLLDLLLPQMSGVDFLRQYRVDHPNAKVIVLTDFDNPKTMEEVHKLDVNDYWMKVENTPHVLAEKVEHFLNKTK